MQRVSIQTAQNVNINYTAASTGDRIVAFILDTIVRYLFVWASFEVYGSLGFEPPVAVVIIWLLPVALYNLWFEILFNGQSLGKMIMKMKVVMVDGTQPSIGAYLLRFVLRFIDITLFTGGVAVLTIIINGKGQRLGDIAAKTTVVKLQGKVDVRRHELIKKMPESYQVQFPAVVDLSDQDISIVMESLAEYRKSANKAPANAAADKIKQVLDISTDLPNVKFLHTVVKDYDYLTSVYE